MAATAPSQRPLGCVGCGAKLSPPPAGSGGGELVCPDCCHVHVHEHPPAAAINASLTPGQAVLVEWGERWWPATVVAARGPRRWLIHLDDWTEDGEREVGPEQVRPRIQAPRADPSDNGLVGILLGGVIATGVALAVVIVALDQPQPSRPTPQPEPPHAPAARDDPSDGAAPIANPGQTRVGPDTPLELGQPIHVRWRGDWYRAQVAGLNEDGSVSVDYLGWPARFDQPRVKRGRIRLP